MTIHRRTVNKKVKIGDLFLKLGILPFEHNTYIPEFDLKVKTPYGYNNIQSLFTTEKQSTITTYFKNGKRLTTSPHHQVKSINGEWKKMIDINVGDNILTDIGYTEVVKQNKKDKKIVLYDMTVSEVHCYYSNGILSHNSWCLVSLGAIAVKLGYNVLHYTLELSESYVAKRYDAIFSETSIEKLESNRDNLSTIIDNLPGTLIVKEYSPGRASISTIETHIQKCTDLGTKPDLIIIDYVDLLKSKRKSTEKKEEIDDVYTAAKGLARELKVPVWTVSQVNRAGAKDDIIEGDKAAGSYDKIMIADFAMSLSRKRQDKVNGTGRFHIMKNRYGMDGMSYGAVINTSVGKITIDNTEFDESNIEQGSENNMGGKISNFNRDEREILSKKFFELGGIG
jgi:hypothetical protein